MINFIKAATTRISIFLFAAFIAFSSFKQPLRDGKPLLNTAQVKYIGSFDEKSFFQVQVQNEGGEKFSLTIKDENGTPIYNDVFNDKKFDKKFQFAKLNENAKLTFIIRTIKDQQTQTFEVNASVRVIEDVVITKL